MAQGFSRFEDIDAWKAARGLTRQVYEATRRAPLCQSRSFCDQMQRAALSCMNNVAEGFGRNSDKDFARFLWMAAGSAREVQSTLHAACDSGMLGAEQFSTLYALAEEVANKAAGLARYLRKARPTIE